MTDIFSLATLTSFLIGLAGCALTWILRRRSKAEARRHAGLLTEMASNSLGANRAERQKCIAEAAQQLRTWKSRTEFSEKPQPFTEPEVQAEEVNELESMLREGAEQQRIIMAALIQMRARLEEAQSAARVASGQANRAAELAAQNGNELETLKLDLEQMTSLRDDLEQELAEIRSGLRTFTESLLGAGGKSFAKSAGSE